MDRRSLMLAALACLLAGCKEEAEVRAPEVRPVRTVEVERRALTDSRTAVGEIRPERDIDLSFRVSGKLVERLVDVGDGFRAGDVLARLDDEDYVHRLTSARGDVAAAEAVLVEARGQQERTAKLYRDGFATRPQMDSAVKGLHSAEDKLESARAALKLAESQLAYTALVADFDGIVTATGAEEGQVVNTGQLILRAADPDRVDAVFAVSEEALGRDIGATRGTPVVVSLLGDPGVVARGTVREVSPVADAATRTYQVRVGLGQPPAAMRFGASVNGRVERQGEPVVVLPASALFDAGGEPAVWVVDPAASQVTLKPVAIGRYEADRIVVAAGLAEGELVVTAGVHQLRENQKVAILKGHPK
jgi:RND family efflux transporter MFP subunit